MMTDAQKNDNPEEAFLSELFASTEKDQDDQLYKKDFYVLEEEIAKKKDQNSIKFKHDVLLKKLILDDYCQYPPKRETNYDRKSSSNDGGNENAVDNESEFLKEVQRINYLTFSPFGLKFFDNPVGSDNCSLEDEKKLHKLLNFDYEHFELNDDLIFNICQGYVNINKLTEDNITASQDDNSGNIGKKSLSSDDEDIDLEKLNLFREKMKTMRETVTDGNFSLIEQQEEKVNQLILNSTKKQINSFLSVYCDTFKEKEEEENKKKREIEMEKEKERAKQIEIEYKIKEEEVRKKEEYLKNKELYLKKGKTNQSIHPTAPPKAQAKTGTTQRIKQPLQEKNDLNGKKNTYDRTEWTKPKRDNYFEDYY